MQKKIQVTVEQIKLYCDSCGAQISFPRLCRSCDCDLCNSCAAFLSTNPFTREELACPYVVCRECRVSLRELEVAIEREHNRIDEAHAILEKEESRWLEKCRVARSNRVIESVEGEA